MKALSIRQPWAWLIVHGHKDIENRNWDTRFRGEFLVHAPSKLYGTIEERERLRKWVWDCCKIVFPLDDEFQTGGIVGKATLVDVREGTKVRSFWRDTDWSHAFYLECAKPLPFRPCAGRLGFFEV